jgi:ABC-type glycerol-3-phosphate transport system substrate-binding protein
MARRDFLKAAGAGLGAATLSPALAWADATLAEAAEAITLSMWIWETVPHWKTVVAGSGLAQRFPNVKMQFTALDINLLHQKLLTGLTAGLATGLPDICRISVNSYRQIASTKAVMEVTEQVGPYRKDVVPALYDNLNLHGRLYAVPDDFGAYLMGYRTDIFAQAGLPTDPARVAALWPTWDDFIAVGKHIKAKLGINLINVYPDGTYQTFEVIKNQGSTGTFDADGNVIFDSAYHVQAANIWKRLWQSGLVTTFNYGTPQYWTAHADGLVATKIYPNWEDFVVLDFIPKSKGEWRVTRLPAVYKGSPRIAATDGCAQVIPSLGSPDRQKIALAVAIYMRLSTKPTVSHMNSFPGAFVSYIPGLEAMRPRLSPVMNHQSVYGYFLDAITAEHMLPWYRSSAHFDKAEELLTNAIFAILTKGSPIQATLKDAADQVRALQRSSGVM